MAKSVLEVVIKAQDKASGKINKVNKSVKTMGSSSKKAGSSLAGMGAKALGAVAALSGLVVGMKKVVGLAMEQEKAEVRLAATLNDGSTVERTLNVAPGDWKLEYINAPYRAGVSSEAFKARRGPELARIVAARDVDVVSDGWRQDFVWPVTGRQSGYFGSQRVYQGKPGSYHGGADIAVPTGTVFVAPADGVVTLAAKDDFTLEGKLIIIDHGMGLNSAFLHASEILVNEGDRVKQGQPIGKVGQSGRATGPHLHWGLKWKDARIDPLLVAGPPSE